MFPGVLWSPQGVRATPNGGEVYDNLASKPLQVVTRVNEPRGKRGVLIDVRRCRRNALVVTR